MAGDSEPRPGRRRQAGGRAGRFGESLHPDAVRLIRALDLAPHPEGGYYRETFRAEHVVEAFPGGQRAASTAIYYLLPAGSFSALHRVRWDEAWHHYGGDPVDLHLFEPSRAGDRRSPGGRGVEAGDRRSPGGWDVEAGDRRSPGGRGVEAGDRRSPGGPGMEAGDRRSPGGWGVEAGDRRSPGGRENLGDYRVVRLGSRWDAGERPQHVVPGGVWQAAVTIGDRFALCGCTVAPGFDFADFELASRADLLDRFPGQRAVIASLTRS